MAAPSFPIPLLAKFQKVSIDPFSQNKLTDAQRAALAANIEICRDAIVFFTACGSGSGYGGHTGGAFDTVPEVMLLDAFFRACPEKFVQTFFDEAGHRVATQYLMSVLRGHMPAEQLMSYRKGHAALPGHPELGLTPGVEFSSGRLGHMWPYVNGVAMANPSKVAICLGSDGSQQEGNDAEAARLAAAQGLNVKVIIDDNNVTIAGHPSDYMKGYSVDSTLKGHGIPCFQAVGEDLDSLFSAMKAALTQAGPAAVIVKRKMAPGIEGLEGETHGHDAISVKLAIPYLQSRGYSAAVSHLKTLKKSKDPYGEYKGSGKKYANRKEFGKIVADILSGMDAKERKERVMVIDCDLEGSTGLATIRKAHPEVYVLGGIMERGNISAAAGFGMQKGKQGIFSTFSAFLEMCISELTMARLNNSNLLCHFSHAGTDDMADSTCHFGINNFFADNGLTEAYDTQLYYPADVGQLRAVMNTIFFQEGMRFVFTNRSSLPEVLDTNGKVMHGPDYVFKQGEDEIIRTGTDGYVVSFGDALYRSLDAVDRLREQGLNVGLINKVCLNTVDTAVLHLVGNTPFVLVVEPFNTKTGLGIRYGTQLLKNGLAPRYAHIGAHKEGSGGLWEHAYHQGYDSASIQAKIKSLANHRSLL